jgi:sugar phosphate isomerase/epimerase
LKEAGIYLSSGAFAGLDVAGILDNVRAHAVPGLELSSGLAASTAEIALVEDAVADGLGVLVHNYVPAPTRGGFVLNLADPDPEARARSVEFARESMRLAARLGAPFYSVHAGFGASLEPRHLGAPDRYRALPRLASQDRRRAHDRMRDSVERLAEHGQQIGVALLIENNVVNARVLERGGWHGLLLAEADEIAAFLDAFAGSPVGLLLDTAHAAVTCRSMGHSLDRMLDEVLPFVRALHVSHTDGIEDRNLPLIATSPGLDILAHTPGSPVVIEAYQLDASSYRSQIGLVERARVRQQHREPLQA